MDPACDIAWILQHQVCYVDKATRGMLSDWGVRRKPQEQDLHRATGGRQCSFAIGNSRVNLEEISSVWRLKSYPFYTAEPIMQAPISSEGEKQPLNFQNEHARMQ